MDSSAYQPPVKRSLSDEELDARVKLATSTHSGIEALMELLVAQESLRAQELAETEAWVRRMEEEDSPEARQALAKFRGDEVPEVSAVEPVAETEQEPNSAEPFTWFTKTTEEAEGFQPQESTDVVVVEEIIEVNEFPTPVGSETIDDFEQLLSSASAEEELTALDQADNFATIATPNLIVPTDSDRNQKPIGQLILWLGASVTIIPLMLSWILIQLGLSAPTIIIDLIIGYILAGALTSMASLAGKRSGLSTATISRAVFGVWGNAVPLTLIYLARIALVAFVLSAILFISSGFDARVPKFDQVLYQASSVKITGGVALAIAILLLASFAGFFRTKATRLVFIVLSSLAFIFTLITLVLGTTLGSLTFASAGTTGFVSKESLAGIAIVFAAVTLSFVAVAPNLSNSIPMRVRGYKLLLVSLLVQTVLPALVAIYGLAWLNNQIKWGNTSLIAVIQFMPAVAQISAVVAITSFIVYFVALQVKTSVLEVMSLFRIGKFGLAFPITLVLVSLTCVLISYQPTNQMEVYLSNLLALLLVISAAWIGMFIADVSLRRIAYHELSLNRSYGYYGKFNVLSFLIWLTVTISGFLFVPIHLLGLSFTGRFADHIGLDSSIYSQAIAFAALVLLAMLLTAIVRVPQIRKQEKEVVAVESRREALNEVFLGQD